MIAWALGPTSCLRVQRLSSKGIAEPGKNTSRQTVRARPPGLDWSSRIVMPDMGRMTGR